jgi:hypothetical protein
VISITKRVKLNVPIDAVEDAEITIPIQLFSRAYSAAELKSVIGNAMAGKQLPPGITPDIIYQSLIKQDMVQEIPREYIYPAPISCPPKMVVPKGYRQTISIPPNLQSGDVQRRNRLGQFANVIRRGLGMRVNVRYDDLVQWVISGAPNELGARQITPGLDLCSAQLVVTQMFADRTDLAATLARRYTDMKRGTVSLSRDVFHTHLSTSATHRVKVKYQRPTKIKTEQYVDVPTFFSVIRWANEKRGDMYKKVGEIVVYYSPNTIQLIQDSRLRYEFMKELLNDVLRQKGYKDVDTLMRTWATPESPYGNSGKAQFIVGRVSTDEPDGKFQQNEYNIEDVRGLTGADSLEELQRHAIRDVDSGKIDTTRVLRQFRSKKGF